MDCSKLRQETEALLTELSAAGWQKNAHKYRSPCAVGWEIKVRVWKIILVDIPKDIEKILHKDEVQELLLNVTRDAWDCLREETERRYENIDQMILVGETGSSIATLWKRDYFRDAANIIRGDKEATIVEVNNLIAKLHEQVESLKAIKREIDKAVKSISSATSSHTWWLKNLVLLTNKDEW